MIDDNVPQTMAMQQLQGSGQMNDLKERLRAYPKDFKAAGEAADRIEWLEQRLRETAGECVQAAARIEALEALKALSSLLSRRNEAFPRSPSRYRSVAHDRGNRSRPRT